MCPTTVNISGMCCGLLINNLNFIYKNRHGIKWGTNWSYYVCRFNSINECGIKLPRVFLLPLTFDNFFLRVNQVHDHNTTLSLGLSTYSISKPWTNYGKYNIRFQSPKIWNSFDIMLKTSPHNCIQKKVKKLYIDSYSI